MHLFGFKTAELKICRFFCNKILTKIFDNVIFNATQI